MKLVCAMILAVSFAAAAKCQLEGGSVLVVVYSKDEIAMASDSRVTNEQTAQSRDDYCKVAAPGGKILFGGTGITESAGVFDAVGLARRIVDGEGSGKTSVQAIATGWANAMGKNFQKMPRDRLEQIMTQNGGHQGLDCAMFAGGGPGLSLVRVRFFQGGGSRAIQGRIELISLNTPGNNPQINVAGCGEVDILREFTPPRADWAKAEVERWKSLTGDVQAKVAIRLVQLTISHEKPARFGAREIVPVGGPIDAAEIRRGADVKWIQRKPNCPAN